MTERGIDRIIASYLACSEAAEPPDLLQCDGRTAKAFGVDIPDDKLDAIFQFSKDGMVEIE